MTSILISLGVFVLPSLVLYGLDHLLSSPHDSDQNGYPL